MEAFWVKKYPKERRYVPYFKVKFDTNLYEIIGKTVTCKHKLHCRVHRLICKHTKADSNANVNVCSLACWDSVR